MLRTLYFFSLWFLYSCQEPGQIRVAEKKAPPTTPESQSALATPRSQDSKQKASPMQNPEKEFRLSHTQLTKGIPVHPEKAEDILLNE
jgi:hypothetical protein